MFEDNTFEPLARSMQERFESPDWPQKKEVSGNEYFTLWGAANRLSTMLGIDPDGVHLDSLQTRLPAIKEAANSGELPVINARTTQVNAGKAHHTDIVLEDDFYSWVDQAFPLLDVPMEKAHGREVSKREKPKVIELIVALRKMSGIQAHFDPRGVDLLKYLEDLLVEKYQGLPEIKILQTDMQLKGLDKIGEKTIRNIFNKLSI